MPTAEKWGTYKARIVAMKLGETIEVETRREAELLRNAAKRMNLATINRYVWWPLPARYMVTLLPPRETLQK